MEVVRHFQSVMGLAQFSSAGGVLAIRTNFEPGLGVWERRRPAGEFLRCGL